MDIIFLQTMHTISRREFLQIWLGSPKKNKEKHMFNVIANKFKVDNLDKEDKAKWAPITIVQNL